MTKESEFYQLLHTLRRNYPNGVTTWSNCINECGEPARGGGKCATCCESEIGLLVGNDRLANAIHETTKQAQDYIALAIDSIEDQEK